MRWLSIVLTAAAVAAGTACGANDVTGSGSEQQVAEGENLEWDKVTAEPQAMRARGAASYVKAVRTLGYHAYGFEVKPSVPDEVLVLQGLQKCYSLKNTGYQEYVDQVAASAPGVMLTKDYTIDMVEEQLAMAAHHLCPEFTDELPG